MTTDIETTLAARSRTHGLFLDNANISQLLKDVMRSAGSWDALTNDQREALEMIALKTGRILSGDAFYVDHWRDIEGYGKLVADRLENS